MHWKYFSSNPHDLKSYSCAICTPVAVTTSDVCIRNSCKTFSHSTDNQDEDIYSVPTLAVFRIFKIKDYTANVLSVEIADVCLQSKSKDSHWLFLHVSVCDWLQKFVCCFNVISKAKSTEKWTLFIQNYRYLFVLLANFFHNVKFSQFFYCI